VRQPFDRRISLAERGDYAQKVTAPPPDHTNRPRAYGYGGHEGRTSAPTPVYATPPAGYGAPRRRRRRGGLWLILLIVLVGLLVVADRVAASVTESQLASRIQQSQHLSQKPSVSVDGFPFLTQLASRNFGHATVDINDFTSGGVPIAHIHADLRGVHVASGYDSATVDTLTGTATLDYASVSRVLSNDISNIGHLTLSQGTGNRVKATYSLLGTTVSAQVAVNVLGDNTLEFKTAPGSTPLSGLGINIPGFDVKVPLSGLPFGMQLSSVKPTSTGVDVSASGKNVFLTKNSVGTGG
jgi:LmeA-like phospholipid-binding